MRKRTYSLDIYTIFALLVIPVYFKCAELLGPPVWSKVLEAAQNLNIKTTGGIYCVFLVALHTSLWVSCNLVMLCIYKAAHPFFEQYKSNDIDWPWNRDPKEWR